MSHQTSETAGSVPRNLEHLAAFRGTVPYLTSGTAGRSLGTLSYQKSRTAGSFLGNNVILITWNSWQISGNHVILETLEQLQQLLEQLADFRKPCNNKKSGTAAAASWKPCHTRHLEQLAASLGTMSYQKSGTAGSFPGYSVL